MTEVVMETLLQDNFVPNDTNLHAEREYCQIVTGPNMGGKSCYIRQVALITIMAQVGSFVPALSAKLHVVDGIYIRMGASDSIQQGRSTFLEEMSEASHILKNCTNRSLVIIDELGRGTSTHDGVSIAYATLQYLLEQKRCMVLFVTHYPKIVELMNEFPGSVGLYHVSYLASEKDVEDVTYLYKLVPGVSERSFGFKVAQLAQLPSSCIQQAIIMAATLEKAVSNRRKNRFLINYPVENLPNVKDKEAEENALEASYNSRGGNVESIERFAIGFSEFLLNIDSAFLEKYDVVERFNFLKHAMGLSSELLKWQRQLNLASFSSDHS